MTDPMFNKLAILGLGLIGSSISHAARRANLVDVISGSARSAKTRETALQIGLVDSVFEDPSRWAAAVWSRKPWRPA